MVDDAKPFPKYVAPKEYIPVDKKHRWMFFALPPEQDLSRLKNVLSNAGMHSWNLRETAHSVDKKRVSYAVAIEATVADIRPVDLAIRLKTDNLLVVAEPLPPEVELLADLAETGDVPKALRYGMDDEIIPPQQWYSVLVYYYEDIPASIIVAKLTSAGYEALPAEKFGISEPPKGHYLFVHTGNKSPTVRELKRLIDATALYVNMYPLSADDIQELNKITDRSIRMKRRLDEFADTMADVVDGAADLATGTGKVAAFSLYASKYLLGAGLIAGAGLLGWFAWKKAKNL